MDHHGLFSSIFVYGSGYDDGRSVGMSRVTLVVRCFFHFKDGMQPSSTLRASAT